MRDADVALFLIDAREGLTPLDEEIGRWLRAETHAGRSGRQQGRRAGGESGIFEAYRLGLGEPIALSAEHGEGVADLFEALRPHVEHEGFEDDEEDEGGERAAEARHRRPAERRQVDAGQPDARRGADDHRTRSRDHARFDQPRLGMGRPSCPAGRHGGPAEARQGRGQARAAVGRRYQAGDRLCRSRRAAARRHAGPGSAGSAGSRAR